jgi:hypothetical protein
MKVFLIVTISLLLLAVITTLSMVLLGVTVRQTILVPHQACKLA